MQPQSVASCLLFGDLNISSLKTFLFQIGDDVRVTSNDRTGANCSVPMFSFVASIASTTTRVYGMQGRARTVLNWRYLRFTMKRRRIRVMQAQLARRAMMTGRLVRDKCQPCKHRSFRWTFNAIPSYLLRQCMQYHGSVASCGRAMQALQGQDCANSCRYSKPCKHRRL